MGVEPFIIGLTGNIATGKSTVAAMLASLGACVIDADRVGHHVMRAGTSVHQAIVERFGGEVVATDGEIDRRALGAIVFADPEALGDLERIVHPAAVQETLTLIAACTGRVRVMEAIKLIEAHMDEQCDAIWVVTTRREQQLARLMQTRGLSRADAEQRMAAQPPAEAKLARADVIIDNAGSLQETWLQVRSAWEAIPGTSLACGEGPNWNTEAGEASA